MTRLAGHFAIAVGGELRKLVTQPLGIASASEIKVGHVQGIGWFLASHVRHLAYFPRRLEDKVLGLLTT